MVRVDPVRGDARGPRDVGVLRQRLAVDAGVDRRHDRISRRVDPPEERVTVVEAAARHPHRVRGRGDPERQRAHPQRRAHGVRRRVDPDHRPGGVGDPDVLARDGDRPRVHTEVDGRDGLRRHRVDPQDRVSAIVGPRPQRARSDRERRRGTVDPVDALGRRVDARHPPAVTDPDRAGADHHPVGHAADVHDTSRRRPRDRRADRSRAAGRDRCADERETGDGSPGRGARRVGRVHPATRTPDRPHVRPTRRGFSPLAAEPADGPAWAGRPGPCVAARRLRTASAGRSWRRASRGCPPRGW